MGGRRICEFKASLGYKGSSRTARAMQRNPISKNQKQKVVLRGQSSACQMAEVRRQCKRLQEMATLPLLRNQNKICDNFKSSDQGPLKPWVCNCHRFLSCPMKNNLDFQYLNWNFPVWSLWSKRWGQQEVTCMHMQRPPQKRRGRIPAEWTKASTKQLRPFQQQALTGLRQRRLRSANRNTLEPSLLFYLCDISVFKVFLLLSIIMKLSENS